MRLALALCAAVALLLAAPATAMPAVHDLPTTSVDITVPDPNHPNLDDPEADKHVVVTVSRIDELVDDTSGDLLAARIVDVGFTFDLPPADTVSSLGSDAPVLLVNSVPVKLGVSQLQVETTVVASAAIADVLPPEILSLAFDIGLAVVDVTATEEKKVLARADLVGDLPADATRDDGTPLPDLLEVRRVTVTVHVSEINGVKVEQADLVEQVVDILAEGYLLRAPPTMRPATDDPQQLAAMAARRDAHRQHCMGMRANHRVAALWSRLPHATRVAVAAFFGSLLILVLFVALPLAAYVHWKERREGYVRLNGSQACTRLATIEEEDEEEEAGEMRERALPAPPAGIDEKAWLRASQ